MDRELLHVKLIREIISRIAQGTYPVGKRLPAERKLCEYFRVSRGTLRQALADLVEMGLVTIRPGSGAYVRRFSPGRLPPRILPPDFRNTSLQDIVLARKAIELPAFELACDHITPEQLDELQSLVDKMRASVDDLPEFLTYDFRFHQLIVRAGGNSALYTALQAISEYHKYSQIFTGLHEGAEDLALTFHETMLDALKKGHKIRGARALRDHLDNMLTPRDQK